ncbi:MAG: glycosyltransferase [Bacteroidales bacterium]|jgi:glycosyltransferase involved in cell wall biosynthesis|nr:glycosyltransferase [Bacteroidales bacterium]
MSINLNLNIINQLSITEIIFIIILILSFCDQIFFYLLYYSRLKPYLNNNIPPYSCEKPLSVIISAKNEAKNLKKSLPLVLNQDYPDFEVILVNDGSTDNTSEILKEFSKTYNNLKIINIEQSHGKKEALSIAIQNSSHEYLVFTDADCYPLSEKWLSTISSKFSEKKQIILGYGAYEKQTGFLNGFIRYDTFLIALQYFTAANMGVAYMGVGRNLAYTKKTWIKTQGFESHKNILSGDDDLFIIQAATYENVEICLDSDAFTYSIPKKTLHSFVKQKSRHVSTSSKYKFINILFSAGELISRSVFFISAVILLAFGNLTLFILMLLTIRIIIIYTSGYYLRKKLKNKIKFHFYILFDIFAPIFYLGVFAFKLLTFNKKEW